MLSRLSEIKVAEILLAVQEGGWRWTSETGPLSLWLESACSVGPGRSGLFPGHGYARRRQGPGTTSKCCCGLTGRCGWVRGTIVASISAGIRERFQIFPTVSPTTAGGESYPMVCGPYHLCQCAGREENEVSCRAQTSALGLRLFSTRPWPVCQKCRGTFVGVGGRPLFGTAGPAYKIGDP